MSNLSSFTATKKITSDTTYYISTGGSDSTGDGSSGNPWATPQKALDYLKDKWIANDATITIDLADGTYTMTSAIEMKHPCGKNIRLIGNETAATSRAVGSVGVTGSDDYVEVNGADYTADYPADSYIRITDNTAAVTNNGAYKVKSVSFTGGNTRIVLNGGVLGDNADNTGNVENLPWSHKVKLTWADSSTNGVLVQNGSTFGLINGVRIKGDGAHGVGIYASEKSVVNCGTQIVVDSFLHGIYSNTGSYILAQYAISCYNASVGMFAHNKGSVVASSSVASNNNYGYDAYDSSFIYIDLSTASNNTEDGIRARYNTYIDADYIVANKNGSDGIYCATKSYVNALSAAANANGERGFYVLYNSFLYAIGAEADNNTYGFRARFDSFINANTATANDNSVANFSPATTNDNDPTFANYGSWIYST